MRASFPAGLALAALPSAANIDEAAQAQDFKAAINAKTSGGSPADVRERLVTGIGPVMAPGN